MCAQTATSNPSEQSDAAEQKLQREYHRTQFAGALAIGAAPRDLAHGGLIEAEIEQRRQRRKRGVESDQAITLAAEQAKIDDVESQRKDQPGTDAGKIRDNIESLTICHDRYLGALLAGSRKHQFMCG